MATPEPRNTDPARQSSASAASFSFGKVRTASDFPNNGGRSQMSFDGLLRTVGTSTSPSESTLLRMQMALADAPQAPAGTVNEVWREIVSGGRKGVCKEEVRDEEMITLEDFLLRVGSSVEDEDEEVEVKDVKLVQPSPPSRQLSGGMFSFEPKVEPSVVGFGNGVEVIGAGGGGLRGKRGPPPLEPSDKTAQQRQRRMIKNRESAARSRERKQAYQTELESLATKLEEENERLLKEKAERTKERRKQLMERVIPSMQESKSARVLRRVRSMQW